MSPLRTNDRGRRAFALLLVVLTIAALAILVTPFMVSMRLQEISSRNAVAQARARYAVTAAFNHALAQLLQAAGEYGEFAVSFDGLPGEFEWDKAERSLMLAAEIQDEQGKIDVNAAPEKLMAALFADGTVGLGLTDAEAEQRAAGVVALRNATGPLPTLHSLVTGGVFTENHLFVLRPHITVHSAAERGAGFARVNINTATAPVLRAVLAGVRLRYLQPTPDPANTGTGAMSVVDLSLLDLSGTWEVRCTDVTTDADTGARTFTFAVESHPENAPGTVTDYGTFTFTERYDSPGVGGLQDDGVSFSVCNGSIDFAAGDKFTFDAERFSHVGGVLDLTKVNLLLLRLRAAVVSADAGEGTITLDDASKFPGSGYVRIRGDVIGYASRSGNELQGCTGLTITPAAGNAVALIVADMAAFDALLAEAVTDGDLSENHKSAIIANAKNPVDDAILDSTTGLCFASSGRYSIEAVGVVNNAAGKEVQRMRVRRVISLERGETNVWEIASQGAFDREIAAGKLDGIITQPGASFLADVAPSGGTDDVGLTLAPVNEGDGWSFNGPTLVAATNWQDIYPDGRVFCPAIPGTALVPGDDIYRSGNPGLFVTGTKAFRTFAQRTRLGVGGFNESLLVWVKPSGTFGYSSDHVFFDTGPGDASEHRNRIRLFYSSDGKLVFRIAGEAKEPRSAEVRATVGQGAFARETWHKIEAVWSGMDIGQMALLLDSRLIGSYSPSGGDAQDTADPALADEKWIARAGNYLKQQGEAGAVRGTQAGTDEPKSVYGYGACKFINKDASTRKGEFNKVHRGGATLAGALGSSRVAALHADLTADATVIQVDDATNLPKEGYVRIGDEVIKYTDWRLVEIEDSEGSVTETYHELIVPAGDGGRGQDFGDNLATRFQSDAAAHAKDAPVICVSIKVSDNANYPMPHFLSLPPETVAYFGLSGLDPNTCLVQADDEWISYTHRAETGFLVNVRAEVRDLPDGTKTTTMRGAGGTDVAAHDVGVGVIPVYAVTAGGRTGAGDRVTLLHDGLGPDDHKELVIKHAAASGAGYLVSFDKFIPGTHDLCIKKGSATLNAGFIKFPSGRYVPQRIASIGAPVSGAGKRADATIGCVHVFAYGGTSAQRVKEELDASSAGGFDLMFGWLDSLFNGGTQWAWSGGDFGVDTWPVHGLVKIGGEAFFYKLRYPHNIRYDPELGAVSESASATAGGDAGIPATGNIVWTRQGAEQDPIALGFNPHGGHLVITSYSRTKADDVVRSLESCNQEILDWLIAEGHVTQEFVNEHGTQDAETGIWTFDDITTEGGWITTETREFVRYTSIDPSIPGAGQYTFHCDASGRHLYGTHMDGAAALGHAPADDGEGGKLYPKLTARTAAMTVLQRGAASGARALGTERSAHPAGSRILPLPNVPATIISGPPAGADFAAALPYEGENIPVEDTSNFPDSGYVEISDAAGEREIIYYTHKEEQAIPGSNPPRTQYYLSGVLRFRGRFGTTPIDLTGLAAFNDVRDTSGAQVTAYGDPRRLVKLFRPRFHDRMPLLITMDGANETSREYAPHDTGEHLLYFEAKKTVRGAKWLSVDWTETVPENTDIVVLARVGESPSWRSGVPVTWSDVGGGGGRVIYKFDAPRAGADDNAVNAVGDTISVRVFFKFGPGYDVTKWEVPVLKSLTVAYEAGPRVIESEVLDY
ncbi:MAG: hypothetical protein ABIF82_11890 [Planctomycetota bacterium]